MNTKVKAAGAEDGAVAAVASSPAAAIPAQAAVPDRKVRELEGDRMRECEFQRTVWVATAHEGTVAADLLQPEYWTHVAERFKPFDHVEARADDGSWYAEFLVLEAGRRWTRMHPLCIHNLSTPDVSLTAARYAEFLVEYKGPGPKHCVIRRADQTVIHDGEETKEGAYRWLAGRIQAGI